MNTCIKRFIAISLCIVILLPLSAMGATAAANDAVTIFLRGSTDIKKFNEDGTSYEIYDDGEYVSAILAKALPLLPGALITGDYTKYSKAILDVITPAYDAFRPSLIDGSVPENTRPDYYWNKEVVEQMANEVTYFSYHLDDRLSPFVVAEDLHNFIETVKSVTGKSKINLYGRCLGPVAVFTYLYLYERPQNYKNINGLMISFSTHDGMALTDSVFTGDVVISEEAVGSWLSKLDVSGTGLGEEVDLLLKEMLGILGAGPEIGFLASILNTLYGELKDVLFKPLVKEYYALCIMNLCCINEKFDDMMNYLFSDEGDSEKYAYVIGELTRYHEEVYPEINNMMAEIKNLGKSLIIMADYGGQQYPLNEAAGYLGDHQVGTKEMSLGATTAKVGKTLSDEYIAEREALGFGKYISPDKKIDASTCLFPDNTFFVQNLDHTWPARYAGIELDLLTKYSAFDINTNPEIPQFLFFDEANEKLVPLADVELKEDVDYSEGITGFFGVIFRLVEFIKNIIIEIIEMGKSFATV